MDASFSMTNSLRLIKPQYDGGREAERQHCSARCDEELDTLNS